MAEKEHTTVKPGDFLYAARTEYNYSKEKRMLLVERAQVRRVTEKRLFFDKHTPLSFHCHSVFPVSAVGQEIFPTPEEAIGGLKLKVEQRITQHLDAVKELEEDLRSEIVEDFSPPSLSFKI